MVGLVNALGMADLIRTQAADRAAKEVIGIFVPVKRGDDGVYFQSLRSAVQRASGTDSSGQRPAPDGEESDRFAQAELEAREPPSGVVGQMLDLDA